MPTATKGAGGRRLRGGPGAGGRPDAPAGAAFTGPSRPSPAPAAPSTSPRGHLGSARPGSKRNRNVCIGPLKLRGIRATHTRARLTVRSPKTEHHDGHEQRIVPITPKLMTLLQDRFAEAEVGEPHLVTISGKGAVIRQVRAIWKRAGVEPWKRLWQTLRQSCEKEWAMTFPQYAVSKWIGHSITISGRHYANDVPDELFTKAADVDSAGSADGACRMGALTDAPLGLAILSIFG